MATTNNARIKLEQSRLFAFQAFRAKPDERFALVSNFEAAIVFARSITFCLQKDFHDKPGFAEWYSNKQEMMKQDPLFSLFLEKRNYILKQGTSGVHKSINLEITETVSISDFVTCKVIRGRPWYRRPLKVIWEDMRASIREPLREWNWKRKMKRKAKRKKQPSIAKVTEGFYFDDPAWNGREIFDLFEEYLGKLELIVAEAERAFS